MAGLVPLFLTAWVPIVVLLCWLLPPRTAVLSAYIFALLFLPVVAFNDPTTHHLTKTSATDIGVLIGAILFHSGIIRRFRFQWFDVPMILWCLCPIATSISNDLGVQDGIVSALETISIWGVPYFVGRIYFNGIFGLRQVLTAMFIGALVYIPFCLFEIRLSPQLHRTVYGYYQHSFGQTMRFGGFRPMVFMEHGLMVGLWMCMGVLAGFTLWWTGIRRQLFGVPIVWLIGALLVTAVACKSVGAMVLMMLGIAVLYASLKFKSRLVISILAIAAPVYIYARLNGQSGVENLIDAAQQYTSEDRGNSLRFRVLNEELLMTRAFERPWFGWGGYDRASVYDEYGKELTISDSLWIITVGTHGLFGVVTVTLAQLLPPLVYLYRRSKLPWGSKLRAPALALATVVLLFSIDNTLNAMINPIFLIAAGGIAGCRPVRVRRIAVTTVPTPVEHEDEESLAGALAVAN